MDSSSPQRSQLSVSSRNVSSSLTARSSSVSDARIKHSAILSGVQVTLTLLHKLVNELQLSADNNLLSWFQLQMWRLNCNSKLSRKYPSITFQTEPFTEQLHEQTMTNTEQCRV